MNVNDLKPKENFRFKAQRVLSNKALVTVLSILLGLFWFFFMKWTAIVVINAFSGMMRITTTTEFKMAWPNLYSVFMPVNPFKLFKHQQWGWLVFYAFAIIVAVVNAIRFGTGMVLSYEPLSDRASEEGHRRWTTKRELWKQYRHVRAAEPEKEAMQYRAEHMLTEQMYPDKQYVPEYPLGDIIGKGGFPIARYNTPALLKCGLVRGFFMPLRKLSGLIEKAGLLGAEWTERKDKEWRERRTEKLVKKHKQQ
jgi:hypothetical protein